MASPKSETTLDPNPETKKKENTEEKLTDSAVDSSPYIDKKNENVSNIRDSVPETRENTPTGNQTGGLPVCCDCHHSPDYKN